ncbi:MAG TPA: amino acid adenylation domain-containing protein, partial [Longimicrobium sp.]|nr:amino acid adenylation domain-containing protein [Longimicrobium sp.]
AVEVERLRGAPVLPPIVPTGRTGPLPLSFAQERLWFLGQLQPGDTSYNVPAAFILGGPLDVDALGRALSEIVRRHQVLRTVLPLVDGAPAQVVLPAEPLPLPVHGPVPREELGRIAEEEARHAFDLTTGPLLRARLVRLEAEEHALFLTMHHVVFDGWSVGVLLAELSALYSAFAAGEPSPLPELPVQYGDYAVWQREHLAGEQLERQLEYWKAKLAGAPELLELPTDRPRPAVQRHRGAVKRVMVPAEAARAVRELVRGEESTPFMGLLAAWQALLGRYAGQREVVVGTPIAGRTRSEVEPLIGFFVNTLALRTDLSGNPSFRQLLARVRETTLDAYAHQDLPFERLVAEVKPARTLSHAPVFQTTFTYEGAWARADRAPAAGVSIRSLSGSEPESSKFDLSLVATERSGGALQLTLTYDRDLFEAATAERLLDRYTRLLEQVAAAPDRPLAALPLLSAEEREAALKRAAPRREPCAPETIHSLVEASAALTPNAVAVSGGGATLTYAELDARANRFAHHLRARFGVAAETRVAVFMERSPELVVVLLGIFKAGGVYVPLDPTHPEERNRWILEDSGARVLVAGAAPGAWISPTAARVLELELAAAEIAAAPETHPGVEVHPDQLAYVVYTSGSTGRPKGVLGVHRGAANFLRYVVESYALGPDDAVLQMAGASFDASFRDTIGPLAAGARVLFAGKEAHSDPGRLLAVVAEHHPTAVLSIVPSVLRAHVAHAEETGWAASSLRLMLLSGEPLAATDCRRAQAVFGRQLTLVNQYGPTETTMTATFFPVTEPPADGTQIPVGEPIRNMELYVLDDAHDLVPDGVTGELCIGGVGVTRGYANRPALTAELFIPHPWPAEPGARLYRTGDLFRRECDGTLRFLGRRDQQVKVRGVRVEPGEVEAALRAHPALRDAAVAALPQGDGSTRLRAFWTAADGVAPDAGSLRAFLRERLPEALVPEEYVQLPALPRTPNGKLDRGALPLDAVTARPAYEAPRTAVEEVLALLLAELLETEAVGRDDDFFALGGHSLTAMRLAARVRAALRAELPLMAVFAHPTPRGMAEQLVAHEPARGRVEQVARLYLKVVRMSDGEVAAGLEREAVAGSPAR